MKPTHFLLSALALAALATACKPELSVNAPSAGATANFSKYVAIGNSLTAGYADGGLYLEGQLASYPSIISKQLASIGGTPMVQPLLLGNGGGYRKFTGFNPTTKSPIVVVVPPDGKDIESANPVTPLRDFPNPETVTNLGIPGIRMYDVTAPYYGAVNLFMERLVADDAQLKTSYYDLVKASKPTFFSFWLGSNDVLGYALSGGTNNDLFSGGGITPQTVFESTANRMLDSAVAGASAGVIANIPDVASTPLFTTIPYNLLPFTAEQALAAQTAYLGYNQAIKFSINPARAGAGLPAFDTVRFAAGQNAPIIVDGDEPFLAAVGGLRQLKSSEFLLLTLPSDSLAPPTGWGTRKGIPSQYVLTQSELKKVQDATAGYNAFLKAKADARGLAFFDANKFLKDVKAGGLIIDGITMSSGFISGGLFSLDGVHLTPRGYAVVANKMIEATNQKYGSTIPTVNLSDYKGVTFPK